MQVLNFEVKHAPQSFLFRKYLQRSIFVALNIVALFVKKKTELSIEEK